MDVEDEVKEEEEEEGDVDPLLDEIMMDVECLVQNDPSLETPLSLEQILYESESAVDTWRDDTGSQLGTPRKQYAIPAGGIDSDIGETMSVSSFGSRGTRSSQHSTKDSGKVYGSIFRHVILKGISAQVTSAATRVNAGHPTCMAATHLIAVGTQSAHIFVFDSNQVIKWFLGGPDIGANYGAVSCLAFSRDSTRLLVGFARGQVIEYDMLSGKLIRDLGDVHPPGSAVVNLRYSDDNNVAFLADSGGSVFELSMKRGLRGPGASCRCIFSGSRGEVCTMEPLHVSRQTDHPLSQFSILALATISKVIVITVKPRLKVLMTTSLTGDLNTLPHICWQFVIIQNQFHNRTNDPVLTFARGHTIHFYQVSVNLNNKILFIPLQTIQVGFQLLSVSWLNSRCLGLLDHNEHFHLLDVRSKETLETLDLSQVELVYQTQFFKGLANGGNVSAAFSLAGEVAVYGSSAVFPNQILILGKSTFHALMLRTWAQRLDHLIKDNKYLEALNLGLEMFDDPGKSLVGLHGSKERKRAHISLRLMGILKKFLDLSLTKNFPAEGGMGTLTKYFNDIVPPCIQICIRLNKIEFLFDKVWNSFQLDPFSCAAFLENLEPYILSDQLSVIPTSIIQQLVEHYEKRGKLHELEACITHISVMCLDIHQIMLVCERHNLYDAIIYIHNTAILDYISPAERMLSELRQGLSSKEPLTQTQIEVGNKLLVYISCCLAGRAYPFGDIPKDRVKQVKYDIYSTITLIRSRQLSEATEEESEPPFPHLHTLLAFDTQAFLNVLSIAFEEQEYQTEIGRSQKQRIVDLLLQVMVKEDSPFSASQIGFLFTFLARQLARVDNSLDISRDLFSKVLNVLTNPDELSHREERQDALLEMINSGGWELFDQKELEVACQRIGFYRLLKLIFNDRGEYAKILDCYIKDKLRRVQVFSFVQSVFTDDIYSNSHRADISNKVLENLNELVDIDTKKTSSLLFHFMVDLLPPGLEMLRGTAHYFDFLANLLELSDTTELGSPRHSVQHIFTDQLTEEFIELLCQRDPAAATQYIKTKDKYRVDVVMELCTVYGVREGKVHLLETQGRYIDAFNLLHADLQLKIDQLLDNNNTEDGELKVSVVNASLLVVIQLCQRVSVHLQEAEREDVWCSTLHTVSKHANSNKEPWRQMIQHVISSMLGHVGHKKVVSLILSNPSYSSGQWSDLKQMLLELIETLRYERQLLESGIQLLEKERAGGLQDLVRQRTRAVYSRAGGCSICGGRLRGKMRSVVFSCCHAQHVECVDRCGGVQLSEAGEEVWSCVTCQPALQQVINRVAIPGSGSVDIVLEETLSKAMDCWAGFNQQVDYSAEEHQLSTSYLNSKTFALKRRPAGPSKL